MTANNGGRWLLGGFTVLKKAGWGLQDGSSGRSSIVVCNKLPLIFTSAVAR